jgi:hypothetical protein
MKGPIVLAAAQCCAFALPLVAEAGRDLRAVGSVRAGVVLL